MINCPKCGQEYCTPVKYHVCGQGQLADKRNQKKKEKEFEVIQRIVEYSNKHLKW